MKDQKSIQTFYLNLYKKLELLKPKVMPVKTEIGDIGSLGVVIADAVQKMGSNFTDPVTKLKKDKLTLKLKNPSFGKDDRST